MVMDSEALAHKQDRIRKANEANASEPNPGEETLYARAKRLTYGEKHSRQEEQASDSVQQECRAAALKLIDKLSEGQLPVYVEVSDEARWRLEKNRKDIISSSLKDEAEFEEFFKLLNACGVSVKKVIFSDRWLETNRLVKIEG